MPEDTSIEHQLFGGAISSSFPLRFQVSLLCNFLIYFSVHQLLSWVIPVCLFVLSRLNYISLGCEL